MVCTECGAISDAPVEYEEKLDLVVAELTGCPVEGHTTVFKVICKDCQRKRIPESS
jgi:Fur family peroxide stress response transcriptional regulator